tara:strand:- start:358 stop:726 length:369 start_codon:yes stop_codon:yes gene_type:complete
MAKEKHKQEALENAVMQYVDGSLNGIQTARRINGIMGGINGIVYKSGRSLTVDDKMNKYSLPIGRIKQKMLEKDLIPCMHIVRKENGLGNGTEAHMGRGCSTKHYMAGFNALVENTAAQYGV